MANLTSVDLFSGAGGLSLGLEAAGFQGVAAVEISGDACDTYTSVFPATELVRDSTKTLRFTCFRGIDLIAGGPPCQPFSAGGKRMADQDSRDMLPEFLRAVREAKPLAFLMENVYGLVQGPRRNYFLGFARAMEHLGYSITYRILNAADYGVPQRRRRLFVVGLRGKAFEFPAPTHGPGTGRPHVGAGTVVSPSRVIGEINQSHVFYAKRPDLRPNPYDGHLFNGGGRGIELAQPSPTILASAGGNKTHFLDTLDEVPRYHAHLLRGGKPRTGVLAGGRRISVEESALLQTFPKRVRFAGARSSRYAQVGNAVPPLLAEVIARALANELRGKPVRFQERDVAVYSLGRGLPALK